MHGLRALLAMGAISALVGCAPAHFGGPVVVHRGGFGHAAPFHAQPHWGHGPRFHGPPPFIHGGFRPHGWHHGGPGWHGRGHGWHGGGHGWHRGGPGWHGGGHWRRG